MFLAHPHHPPPIDRLPVELIAQIFVFGAALDIPDSPFLLRSTNDCYIPPASSLQLHVSHVSARWRAIALATPALWTSIRFREPAHLPRACAYLARCSASKQLLDILVDTVAPSEHIPGITLSTEEFHPIFDIISPHVKRWRALYLKVRDNVCKAGARARLSTCGAAPNLETLQLYHFEAFGSIRDLVLATHKPPVPVFENTLPRLRYVSLIGVNLPWRASPFLRNLHQLELALHRETVRPPYMYWERMLRASPDLQKLTLHYSGPRVPTSWPSTVPAVEGVGDSPSPTEDNWPDENDRAISLPRLIELTLMDLDPEYLCLLLDHLVLPAVTTLTLALLDQDYSSFVYKLVGMNVEVVTTGELTISAPTTNGTEGGETEEAEEVVKVTWKPYFGRLERLVVSALDCEPNCWQVFLRSMTTLRILEIDFARVAPYLPDVFVASWLDGAEDEGILLPQLTTFKASHLSGSALQRMMAGRERTGLTQVRWMMRWCERWRGCDPYLDSLVDCGYENSEGGLVRVETWIEDDYDEDEDEGGDTDESDGERTADGSDDEGEDALEH